MSDSKKIRFDSVLKNVAGILDKNGVQRDQTVIVRDVYGRILVLFDFDKNDKAKQSDFLQAVEKDLFALDQYSNGSGSVLCKCDLVGLERVFDDPDILELWQDGLIIRLLERQVVGHDWLRPKLEPRNNPIPRLAFYGFKGGVGRSTTVAAIANLLARSGKKILVFDFDLESPGLSSMLLPAENYPTFGAVDWLVEDTVDNIDDFLHRNVVASSPLAKNLEGDIRIVPAMGGKTDEPRIDPYYISKLSRIYADKPSRNGGTERFSDRLDRLVETIEERERPDVVLIDSRAGLHDLSAGSIVRITDEAFLFVVNTSQSWEGYRMLFSHWKQCPELLAKIRDKLNIVHAMIPVNDRAERKTEFIESSHLLFTDTIYEQSDPAIIDSDEEEPYNFGKDALEAPHYPVDVVWSSSLSEFDYCSFEDKSTRDIVERTYMPMFEKVQQIIQGYANE